MSYQPLDSIGVFQLGLRIAACRSRHWSRCPTSRFRMRFAYLARYMHSVRRSLHVVSTPPFTRKQSEMTTHLPRMSLLEIHRNFCRTRQGETGKRSASELRGTRCPKSSLSPSVIYGAPTGSFLFYSPPCLESFLPFDRKIQTATPIFAPDVSSPPQSGLFRSSAPTHVQRGSYQSTKFTPGAPTLCSPASLDRIH